MPQPWDQLHNESGPAHAGFLLYRDLGPKRTLNDAYRAHRSASAGGPEGLPKDLRAPGTWRRWHKAYQWDRRAKAWDQRGNEVAQEAREKVIADVSGEWERRRQRQAEEEWALRDRLLKRVGEMLDQPVVRKVEATAPDGRQITVYEPAGWDYKAIVQMSRIISELGRISAQMPAKVAEPAAANVEEMFVESSGQLADRLPEGSVPPMPDDPATKPELAVQVGADAGDLQQPARPERPQ